MQQEFTSFQGAAEVRFQLESLQRVHIHGGQIILKIVSAHLFGAVHGDISRLEQRLGITAV